MGFEEPVFCRREHGLLYRWRDIVILFPRGGDGVDAIRPEVERLARESHQIGIVIILDGATPRPATGAHARIKAFMAKHAADIASVAILVPAKGFIASFFISLAGTMSAGPKQRFCRGPLQAGQWLVSKGAGRGASPGVVAAVLEEALARTRVETGSDSLRPAP